MGGDKSRRRDNPLLDFFSVEMQQGKVLLDADWNESAAIDDRRLRAAASDILGRTTVSSTTPEAFKIEASGGNITIGRGRMYVDGLLAENHGAGDPEFDTLLAEARHKDPIPYEEQPYWPTPDALPSGGPHLAYLDVWQREVTHLEHPDLVEPAIGVDTTTRKQTVWQVRMLENVGAAVICDTPNDEMPTEWQDTIAPSAGRLTTGTADIETEDDPCELPPTGGYRGLENQLYRVEIHDGGALGAATFKWSRDNASVGSIVTNIDPGGTELQLASLGRDAVLRLNTNDWVEIIDDWREFSQRPGEMRKIVVDEDTQTISFTPSLPSDMIPSGSGDDTVEKRHFRVRRWDQKGIVRDVDDNIVVDLDGAGSTGVITVPDDGSEVLLEKGIKIAFSDDPAGGRLRAGDYWVFAARATDASVEQFENAPPRGIHHHYARLALVTFDDEETDCRTLWPPKANGCCTIAVEPGDDLQQAIDTVIGRGGGCICLRKGLYEVTGPLLIRNASNLSIYGEGASTVLRLRGTDEQGLGGVILWHSRNIVIEGFVLIGEDVPATVWTFSFPLESQSEFNNESLVLRDLILINATASAGDIATRCALRLAHASDVTLDRCHLIGEIGVSALFADMLPSPIPAGSLSTSYGRGVALLRMAEVVVRYQSYGVWALGSDGWELTGCDIRPFEAQDMTDLRNFVQTQQSPNQFLGGLPEHLDSLIAASSVIDVGTAISGFRWRDCVVRNCTLCGAQGMVLWWWLRGAVVENLITVGERAIHATWMHDAHVASNRITCAEGSALTLVGGYRAVIETNHIRTGTGITNGTLAAELTRLLDYVEEVAAQYSALTVEGAEELDELGQSLAFWMLLRETMRIMKLSGLVQEILKAFVPDQQMRNYVYFEFATWLYSYLQQYDEDIDWPTPLIALRVYDNDLEAGETCIGFDQILPLGGFIVADNRLHSRGGQALRLNANSVAANVHLIILALRFALKVLIENILPSLIDNPQMSTLQSALNMLLNMVSGWAIECESFLEADYRIEGNSIRSVATGVESNIWELTVRGNHITLQEQSLTNTDGTAIVAALLSSMDTRPIAHAIRDGEPGAVRRAIHTLNDEELLSSSARRSEASRAFYGIASSTSNATIRGVANNFATAISNADRAVLERYLIDFIGVIAPYFGSYGIVAGNPGCRIEYNHVLMSPDADLESWGRGGILVTTDQEQSMGSLMLALLLEFAGSQWQGGITETLVSNNEVIGGVGHGIHIYAPIVFGSGEEQTLQLGLLNLRIHHNQIRGMGGAGIRIDEETQAVGIHILDNEIVDCSNLAKLVALTDDKGGIVIDNAGVCRVRGNRITRCGRDLEGVDVFAMDIEGLYGLELAGNELLHNGTERSSSDTGGIRLTDIYGDIAIQNNRILFHTGVSLLWNNTTDDNGDLALPEELLLTIAWYLHWLDAMETLPQDAHRARATVDGNQFKAKDGSETLAFNVLNVGELIFSGNSCNSNANNTPFGTISRVDRCILTNNSLTTNFDEALAMIKIDAGIISSNVGTASIRLSLSPNVVDGLNVPAVQR